MRYRLLSIAVVFFCLPLIAADDAKLEQIMMGARMLKYDGGARRLSYMEVGKWTEEVVLSNLTGNLVTCRWAGTGNRILVATTAWARVVDIFTKTVIFEKTGLTINGNSAANTAADFSNDGARIFFAQGNDIKSISLSGGDVTTLFTTTSANQIREGEMSVSADGKRIVGRYSNNRAVYIDIGRNTHGAFGDNCSPAISPSGTLCATNGSGHVTINVYKWSTDANAPTFWKTVSKTSNVGDWDNQEWSNHESYYVGNGSPAIINVNTGDCYNFGHSMNSSYPDLWVPASAGGVVPAITVAVHGRMDRRTGARRSMLVNTSAVEMLPDHSGAVEYFSITGALLERRRMSGSGRVPVTQSRGFPVGCLIVRSRQ